MVWQCVLNSKVISCHREKVCVEVCFPAVWLGIVWGNVLFCNGFDVMCRDMVFDIALHHAVWRLMNCILWDIVRGLL